MPNKEIEHHIVCDVSKNLDQFPMPNVSSFKDKGLAWQYANRALVKMGWRRRNVLLEEAINEQQPDLLHSHFGDRAYHNMKLAQKYGLKHAVTFYGYDVNQVPLRGAVWLRRYEELFATADLVMCEGPFMASCLAKLGCPEDKLKVQRLGVNLKKIPFEHRVLKERAQLNILIAGTFREKKGIPFALEAVALLRQHYANLSVTIVGNAAGLVSEEKEKEKIIAIINKYRMNGYVKLLGMQTHQQLIELAYTHHLFLSPSITADDGDTEGGAPVTIIEMAASGMPIISTTHCDIPFVLSPENGRHLAPERNVDRLANTMWYMVKNPQQAHEMATANRKYIEQHLNVATCSRDLLLKYKALI